MSNETNKLNVLAKRLRIDLATEIANLREVGSIRLAIINAYYNDTLTGIDEAMFDDKEVREMAIMTQRLRFETQYQFLEQLETGGCPGWNSAQRENAINDLNEQLYNLSKFIDCLEAIISEEPDEASVLH